MNKKLLALGWPLSGLFFLYSFFGLIDLLAGFSFDSLSRVFYSLSLGLILNPYVNKVVAKSKYAKVIRLSVGIFFVSTLVLGLLDLDSYLETKKINEIKLGNITTINSAAKKYCDENERCPSSIGAMLNAGYLTLDELNLEGHDVHDYSFDSNAAYKGTCYYSVHLDPEWNWQGPSGKNITCN